MLTYQAVVDVLSAICGTTLPVFLSTETFWLMAFNNASDSAPLPPQPVFQELKTASRRNYEAIEALKAWLGWIDQWTACSPACELGQVCYIPMWPIIWEVPDRGSNESMNAQRRPDHLPSDFEEVLWKPQCVVAEDFNFT